MFGNVYGKYWVIVLVQMQLLYEGEGKVNLQVYSEVEVTSMLTVRSHFQGPQLGFGLGVRFGFHGRKYGCG